MDDETVRARAGRVRARIAEIAGTLGEEKTDVVIVTHGVFMKFLSGEEGIDLPKAGWKGYKVGEGGGGKVVFNAVDG